MKAAARRVARLEAGRKPAGLLWEALRPDLRPLATPAALEAARPAVPEALRQDPEAAALWAFLCAPGEA